MGLLCPSFWAVSRGASSVNWDVSAQFQNCRWMFQGQWCFPPAFSTASTSALISKFIGGTFKTHWKQRSEFNIFFLYRASFGKNYIWNLQGKSWFGFFSPLPFWHNWAAELILLRLSKKTWRGSRHMIFHTKRNCFHRGKEQGAGRWGVVYPSEEENASQEEKRKRGSLAVMEGWKVLLVVYQLPGCPGVPHITLCSWPMLFSVLTPWARVVAQEGKLEAVVCSEKCLSFLPFIPNVPSCLSLLSQALSPVIWCPVFFGLCCGFIIFFHRGYSG